VDCAELEANLTEFLEGLLSHDAEAAALEHLATCERCEQVLTQTRSVIALAAAHGRTELHAEERDALLDRILSDEQELG
jgi:anti-sigma factor RsiW